MPGTLERPDRALDGVDVVVSAVQAFAGAGVQVTSVLSGAFHEVMTAPFLEIVDWEKGTFSYWGDGDQSCDFTTVADTAACTAAVALDADVSGPVRASGP